LRLEEAAEAFCAILTVRRSLLLPLAVQGLQLPGLVKQLLRNLKGNGGGWSTDKRRHYELVRQAPTWRQRLVTCLGALDALLTPALVSAWSGSPKVLHQSRTRPCTRAREDGIHSQQLMQGRR
jgi:hypothetical protein